MLIHVHVHVHVHTRHWCMYIYMVILVLQYYMYKTALHVILTFELCNSKISGNSVQGESPSVDIPGRCVHLLNEYVASLWL